MSHLLLDVEDMQCSRVEPLALMTYLELDNIANRHRDAHTPKHRRWKPIHAQRTLMCARKHMLTHAYSYSNSLHAYIFVYMYMYMYKFT